MRRVSKEEYRLYQGLVRVQDSSEGVQHLEQVGRRDGEYSKLWSSVWASGYGT
jgi:hypothetical protein